MLSAIIATRDSEQTLVRTLSALVPGATSGVLREVIVTDGGSRDATAKVADIAGCRFIATTAPLGERLKAAAMAARAPWLLFLRAGTVPGDGWIEAVESFIATAERLGRTNRVATFRSNDYGSAERPGVSQMLVLLLLRLMLGAPHRPEQGLLIGGRFYESIGGHPGGDNAEVTLLRRIGRRRMALLPCPIRS